MNKWMEIIKLSTEDAKLGRSPTPQEGMCSVGWDYSKLKKTDYVTMPLMASGSLNFPDSIICNTATDNYTLFFNSSWQIEAVLTYFVVQQDDIYKAFMR